MSKNTTIAFHDPAFADELTELVCNRARRIIREAVQAELEAYFAAHEDTDASGRRQVVRNGYLPECEVVTGVGPVAVQVPKTRDRARLGRGFRSSLLPPYLKNAKRLEAVLPWLYLKGEPSIAGNPTVRLDPITGERSSARNLYF